MRISYWPNLKSAAQIIFKIFGIVCHKLLPVTWPTPRPFLWKIIGASARLSPDERCTKFDVSSSICFEDMLDCMQKIEGSCDLGHAPFHKKLLARPLGFSKWRLCTKFKVSSSSSFDDMFDCMPKISGVTWLRPRPFWGNLLERPLGFPHWSCVPNLKSLAQVVLKICSIVFRKI